MVERWIHLTELGGDPWVLPIWATRTEATNAGRCPKLTKDLDELGVHISTRLTLLHRVIKRVRTGWQFLRAAVDKRGPEHEFVKGRAGVAFSWNSDKKYELLADLDSLLFELNSTCELIYRLFECLHEHAKKPMPRKSVDKSIRIVLSAVHRGGYIRRTA